MPIKELIHIDSFTEQENKTYNLNGIGLQVKEIAEKLGISYETVKCYMKSIKEKLGLSKDKEITAHFWCSMTSVDLDEVKKKVISAVLYLLLLIIPVSFTHVRGRRLSYRSRCNVTRVLTRRNDFTV